MQAKLKWYSVRRRNQLFFEWPQVIVIVAVLGLSLYLKPDRRGYGTHTQLGLPPCLSRVRLGIPCPSCGMTTAFAQMSRGQVGQAYGANYFGPVLYGTMVAWWALLIVFVIRGQRLKVTGLHKWTVPVIVAGYVGVYIITWLIRLWVELH